MGPRRPEQAHSFRSHPERHEDITKYADLLPMERTDTAIRNANPGHKARKLFDASRRVNVQVSLAQAAPIFQAGHSACSVVEYVGTRGVAKRHVADFTRPTRGGLAWSPERSANQACQIGHQNPSSTGVTANHSSGEIKGPPSRFVARR
jgi:hypothetical protein